ncbi:hypothetical protein RRG08_030155 [Elysia crispata]|uniref:Uncharacterized protein n=1 Tax=Elysia crispata TaxID=231223 RepID=A0AAE1DLR3_9GAST|nr:hypothetical protein RRG08_030155 [Elysia crispata]
MKVQATEVQGVLNLKRKQAQSSDQLHDQSASRGHVWPHRSLDRRQDVSSPAGHGSSPTDGAPCDNGGDFYPGYQGYGEYFMGQHPDGPPPGLTFLPPSQGTPPLTMEPPMHPAAGDLSARGDKLPKYLFRPQDLSSPAQDGSDLSLLVFPQDLVALEEQTSLSLRVGQVKPGPQNRVQSQTVRAQPIEQEFDEGVMTPGHQPNSHPQTTKAKGRSARLKSGPATRSPSIGSACSGSDKDQLRSHLNRITLPQVSCTADSVRLTDAMLNVTVVRIYREWRAVKHRFTSIIAVRRGMSRAQWSSHCRGGYQSAPCQHGTPKDGHPSGAVCREPSASHTVEEGTRVRLASMAHLSAAIEILAWIRRVQSERGDYGYEVKREKKNRKFSR